MMTGLIKPSESNLKRGIKFFIFQEFSKNKAKARRYIPSQIMVNHSYCIKEKWGSLKSIETKAKKYMPKIQLYGNALVFRLTEKVISYF